MEDEDHEKCFQCTTNPLPPRGAGMPNAASVQRLRDTTERSHTVGLNRLYDMEKVRRPRPCCGIAALVNAASGLCRPG